MSYKYPIPVNEPVLQYSPGSYEKITVKEALARARNEVKEIPMYIGNEEVFTDNKQAIFPPHDHKHLLGYFHKGEKNHVEQAISEALKAKKNWAALPQESRAAVFLKAADLIAGPYRAEINAATMLSQSKNIYQAEIDSACELIDFLRFNAHFADQLISIQPDSSKNTWNKLEYRPLEGFVFALTPFNFTAIAGNLPAAPALIGNTVIWKPAFTQIYSAHLIMKIFLEAGLPPGVINLIYTEGPETGEVVFSHQDFAGIHFTGSSEVFRTIWKQIGENIDKYKTYPRIVGETGGKDFILVHESANVQEVGTAIIRGAFEYQGQKCSAASRAYIPATLWDSLKDYLVENLNKVKMGPPEDFTNFINAVIDEKSFDKITKYIESARNSPDAEIFYGGTYDKSSGYYISPTIVLTKNPFYTTMCEEIFGPVLTIYVYDPSEFDKITDIVEKTSPYGLTGAIFSKDRYILEKITSKLKNAAGNFYINDKPTGAVVGQQPFGGSRASGTNDKAGAIFNLIRWVSPRTIKENFLPPTNFEYPFMQEP